MSDDGSWDMDFVEKRMEAVGGLADGALQGELSTSSITGMQAARPTAPFGRGLRPFQRTTTRLGGGVEARETHQARCMAVERSGEPRKASSQAPVLVAESLRGERATSSIGESVDMEDAWWKGTGRCPMAPVPRSRQASAVRGRSCCRRLFAAYLKRQCTSPPSAPCRQDLPDR